jgi:hypothetical protein
VFFLSRGISGTFFAFRSLVAGLGFLGLGVAVGVANGVGVGAVETFGVGVGIAKGASLGCSISGVTVSVETVSEAMASGALPLNVPSRPPAISDTARRAVTGMITLNDVSGGSFTKKVCHVIHKSGVGGTWKSGFVSQ